MDTLDLERWFAAGSADAWRALAMEAVRGGKLEREVAPGVTIPIVSDGARNPERNPSRRGPWEVRQEVTGPGLKDGEKQLMSEVAAEHAAPWLRLDRATRAGVRPDRVEPDVGLSLLTRDDLAGVLRRVDLRTTRLVMDVGVAGLASLGSCVAIAHERGLQPSDLRLSIQMDVAGALVRDGELARGVDAAWDDLAGMVRFAESSSPASRVMAFSGLPLAEAGADPSLVIGFLAASAVMNLRALELRGMAPAAVMRRAEVIIGLSGDVLVDIALVRAVRRVMARLAAACGVQDGTVFVHAAQTQTHASARDPWTNLLRSAQVGFSAAVSGADAITLAPHDATRGAPSAEGRRLVRNLHILLRDEARLARHEDPAAGAGTVEALTDALCRSGWARFREIEDSGGLLWALSSGWVRERVADEVARRRARIARRSEVLVGVNQHRDIEAGPPPERARRADEIPEGATDFSRHEKLLHARWESAARLFDQRQEDPAVRYSLDALRSGTPDRVEAATNLAFRGVLWVEIAGPQRGAPFLAPPVPPVRFAAAWELLQQRASASRRTATLWCLGGGFHAREEFARGLFTAGGFDVVSVRGSPPAGDLVVLCASDADLAENAVTWATGCGAKVVVVAGRWPSEPETWRQAGITHVVHVGADVLGVLVDILGRLEGN